MKIISFVVLTFFISLSVKAQTKMVALSTEEIAPFTCKYVKSIHPDRNDTSYYVVLLFQNEEYKSITDIKSLSFSKVEKLNKFINDFDSSIALINDKSADFSWDTKDYNIMKFGEFKKIVITENESHGYAYLTGKQADKISVWLHKIKFGKDEIID